MLYKKNWKVRKLPPRFSCWLSSELLTFKSLLPFQANEYVDMPFKSEMVNWFVFLLIMYLSAQSERNGSEGFLTASEFYIVVHIIRN